MIRRKRYVFYLLIAVLLLFFAVFLFACNESDFYEQFGEPQQITKTVDGGAASDGAETSITQDQQGALEPSSDGDGQSDVRTNDMPSGDETTDDAVTPPPEGEDESLQDPSVDQPATNDNGSGTTDDVLSDGQSPEGQTDVDDEDADQEKETDGDGADDADEEMSALLAEIFDLTVERNGLYRYILFESAQDLPVWVQRTQIGTANLVANGMIVFVCDFETAERELWGKWDEAYNLSAYVLFEDLTEPFRKIEYRPSISMAIQIDLNEEDLAILKRTPAQDGEETTSDPAKDETNADDPNVTSDPDNPTEQPDGEAQDSNAKDEQKQGEEPEETDGVDDPPEVPTDDKAVGDGNGDPQKPDSSEDSGEDLPNSAILSFWEGIGTVRDVEVVVMTAEEEEYSFRIDGTAEDYTALIDVLTPYLTYRNKTVAPEQYQATAVLDQTVFNIFVQITKSESAFSADVKVLGEAL